MGPTNEGVTVSSSSNVGPTNEGVLIGAGLLLAAPTPISTPSFVWPTFDKDDTITSSFVGLTFAFHDVVDENSILNHTHI